MLIKANILKFAVMTVFIRRFCFDNFLCCIFHLPPHCSLARGQHLSLREAGGWAAPSPGREGTFVVAMGVVRRPLCPIAPPHQAEPHPCPQAQTFPTRKRYSTSFLARCAPPGREESKNRQERTPTVPHPFSLLLLALFPTPGKRQEKSGFRCRNSQHQGSLRSALCFWFDVSAGGASQLVCPVLCLAGQKQREKGRGAGSRVSVLKELLIRSFIHSFIRSLTHSAQSQVLPLCQGVRGQPSKGAINPVGGGHEN